MTFRPFSFSKASSGDEVSARSSQKTMVLSFAQVLSKAPSLSGDWISGRVENPALLGGFDRVCLHALDIELGDGRVSGHDRLEKRNAHFDGLLHHIIQPALFQRRKCIVNVLRSGLLPNLFDQADDATALFCVRDLRAPFSVPAVKNEKMRPLGKSQHVQKIMGLRMAKRHLAGGVKIICDKEPLLSHCVRSHFVVMT